MILFKIYSIQTTLYHLQANGPVKRFYWDSQIHVQEVCCRRARNWDRYLPYLLFAYREIT
jgi:hypothetical protein